MFVHVFWSVFCWEMLSLIFFRARNKSIWNAGTCQTISSNFSSAYSSILYLVILEGSEMTNGRLVALIFWRSNWEAFIPAPITSCKKHGWLRLWWWKDGLDCWAGPKDFCLLSLLLSRVLFLIEKLLYMCELQTPAGFHKVTLCLLSLYWLNTSILTISWLLRTDPDVLSIWFDCHDLDLSGSTCDGWEIQITKGGEGCGWLWVIHDGEL